MFRKRDPWPHDSETGESAEKKWRGLWRAWPALLGVTGDFTWPTPQVAAGLAVQGRAQLGRPTPATIAYMLCRGGRKMLVSLQDVSRQLFDAGDQLWTNTGLRQDQYAQPVLALVAMHQMEAKFEAVDAEL